MSLNKAKEAYQRGDLVEVRRIVDELLSHDPNNEGAWVFKMMTAEHAFERENAMQRVLELNPQNPTALKMQQSMATQAKAQSPPATESQPTPQQPINTYQRGDIRVEELGVYEMLWDCEFCGATGLLGKTHRFCPACGGQQNPNKRYFPSDDQKVLVKDHVYHGVDITCPACNTLNSANAEYCFNCGAPLSEGAKAATLADRQAADGVAFQAGAARDLVKERFEAEQASLRPPAQQQTKPKRRNTLIGGAIATFMALCLGICGVLMFWTNEQTVVVSGHSWERNIEIQQFKTVREGDWCDSLPSGARVTSRSEKQRSTRSVPDGEICENRQIDNGDGTFRQVRECRTKYRDEPVYDTYCDYDIDKWAFERNAPTSGSSLTDTPYWATLNLRTGSGLGAEREGKRSEEYTVFFRGEGSKTYSCDFDSVTKWQGFRMESRWLLEVGAVLGEERCDSLKPAS